MSNQTLTPLVGAAAFAGIAPGNYPSSAFLYLSELSSALEHAAAGTDDPHLPTLADQVLAYSAQFAVSVPFNPRTRRIRIQTAGICAIRVGIAPQVVAGAGLRMTSGQTEVFSVAPGDALAVVVTT